MLSVMVNLSAMAAAEPGSSLMYRSDMAALVEAPSQRISAQFLVEVAPIRVAREKSCMYHSQQA